MEHMGGVILPSAPNPGTEAQHKHMACIYTIGNY